MQWRLFHSHVFPNRKVLWYFQVCCLHMMFMIALQGILHGDCRYNTSRFRHLMDYLLSYRNRHIRESVSDLNHRSATTVRGVEICWHDEVKSLWSEPCCLVQIKNVLPNQGFSDAKSPSALISAGFSELCCTSPSQRWPSCQPCKSWCHRTI